MFVQMVEVKSEDFYFYRNQKCMRPRSQIVTRLDYCQYLLVSQINYTLTNFAEHSEKFSHDAINRYLAGERLTPRLVWENVKGQVI